MYEKKSYPWVQTESMYDPGNFSSCNGDCDTDHGRVRTLCRPVGVVSGVVAEGVGWTPRGYGYYVSIDRRISRDDSPVRRLMGRGVGVSFRSTNPLLSLILLIWYSLRSI